MALIMNQNGRRSELQERIATELQERAKKQAVEGERPDHVKDSAYLKNTQKTSWLAAVWIVLAILALIAFIVVVIASGG